MSGLTIGEVREMIVKALISPDHVSTAMEGLFEKGAVLAEKRKNLVDKYKKKRNKVQVESMAEPEPEPEPEPESSQFSDMF